MIRTVQKARDTHAAKVDVDKAKKLAIVDSAAHANPEQMIKEVVWQAMKEKPKAKANAKAKSGKKALEQTVEQAVESGDDE